ncbi:MAG: hypothetical protein KJZ69_07460 [Phycisphaerales bacterium]|nr:hypothetical protein [Phycisphaerales bacterium]
MNAPIPLHATDGLAPLLILAAEGSTGAGAGASALRIFAAMVLLSGLAILATSKSLYRFQRNLLLARYMSGGWIAVLIGFLLGPWGANVVTDEMLLEVRPALMVGLGWIGAIIGLQARRSLLTAVPTAVRRWVAMDALAMIALGGLVSALALGQMLTADRAAWWVAPVGLLITACIGWAAETRSLGEQRTAAGRHLEVLVQAGAGLAAILAVCLHGLLMILPSRDASGDVVVSIPTGALRLLAAALLATGVGFIGRYLLQQAGRERRELLVIHIAMIAIISGIASELAVSPLFAAMLCGIVITNLGGPKLREFERFILRAEQPVAILFALLAGVLLDPRIGVWGAALVAGLVALRVAVKTPLMRLSLNRFDHALPGRSPLFRAPLRQSLVALALAVSLVLHESSILNQRLLTIVIVVGALSELLPFILARRKGDATAAQASAQGAQEAGA